MTYSGLLTKRGDITLVERGIICHQVSAQGVMGSGVAAAIKNKWPSVYRDYINAIPSNHANLDDRSEYMGRVIYTQINDELIIASIVAQLHYGNNKNVVYTSYDTLDNVLRCDIEPLSRHLSSPVHLPKIGCGLANGNWEVVQALIKQRLSNYTVWEL